ncbi:MAG: PilN domain-containing protein [Planctomycetota bacterium]|jgi:Tfp pilus assembly protein PilN
MDKVDFLPERIKAQRVRRRRIWREGFLLIACICALIALGYVRQEHISRAQAELNILNDQAGNIKQQLTLHDALQHQQIELTVMQRIEEDTGSRLKVLDVLGELQFVTPQSVSLTNILLETKELKVPARINGEKHPTDTSSDTKKTEKNVKRVHLAVTGLSPGDAEVENFIGQLSASPLFENVNMDYTRKLEFRGKEAREFQVSCYLVR